MCVQMRKVRYFECVVLWCIVTVNKWSRNRLTCSTHFETVPAMYNIDTAVCLGKAVRFLKKRRVDHVRKIRDGKQRTDIGKYSFVNRATKKWNQLPAEASGTFPCKPKIFSNQLGKQL
jgi:hypothetical protein